MPNGMWNRFRDEVRSASSRTRRGARRAFETGVLRVDLVSLRRQRRQVLADLGERLIVLWNRGDREDRDPFVGAGSDPELLRLRARLLEADAAIASKEAELHRLREPVEEAPPAPAPSGATPES